MLRKSTRAPIGYIRDRSAVYREKWEALHPNRGASAGSHAVADRLGQAFRTAEEARLLGDSGATSSDTAVEMLPYQNPLMAAEQRINSELERAKADLATLAHLQSAAQEDLFGQNSGRKAAVDERRAQLRARIRSIHNMINDLGPADSQDTEGAAVAARVKRAKATALNEIAMELNRKEIADIQSRAPHGVPGMDRSRMDAVFSQLAEPTPAYAEQQMQQLSNMQHAYAERDEAVAELIKEVTEIQEVMRDISVLVVEQGSMVDRIDQNIETAAEAVDRGVEYIRKAHESSKGGAMATCIFVLLIMIFIMFVLMVIKKVI